MRATGIVRRIDELGRVVIPKEIRRTLRIREGDPLEIFTDREGEVILKKYSPVGEMGEFASQFADSMGRTLGCIAFVTDRDSIIAVSGAPRKDYIDRALHDSLEHIMSERKPFQADARTGKTLPIMADEENGNAYSAQTIVPIVSEGEPIGVVAVLKKEDGAQMGETEMKVCRTAAGFLGRQMEQ